MGIDEHNTPCVDWRWWNEMSRTLLNHAQGIKPEFNIEHDLEMTRNDIIDERERNDGMDPEEARAEPISAKELFHHAFWDGQKSHDQSYDNMDLIIRSAFYDTSKNALNSKKDLLLQFCKVCNNAGLDKDAVYKALDSVTEEIYGSDYDADYTTHKGTAGRYFYGDVYELIKPVLSAQKDIELTNGNDAAEIQQQVSEHPKECLHAILQDVAKQYDMAAIAWEMSTQAMECHLDADLRAYQEALYETALEHEVSHDDLEYAFGGNFVAEMENREQMQQVEKNMSLHLAFLGMDDV